MFGFARINKEEKAKDALKELNKNSLMNSLGYTTGLLETSISSFTLTEGIEVYKSLRKIIDTLTKKFSIEELKSKREEEPKALVTQEEFNKFFEEEILSKIDQTQTIFPDKNSFSRIGLCNSIGGWLFVYNTDPEDFYFYYQYDRVYTIIMNKFSLQEDELQALMKSLVESHFNLSNPGCYYCCDLLSK
jgi:hypothetical protein